MTDIVLCTKDRLALLTRTLTCLFERTTSPYRLHVIDDASTDGTAAYLMELQGQGMIDVLALRRHTMPVLANWNDAAMLAESDVLVFTEDDALCPALEPDWLARGLAAMAAHPSLGLMALNNPSCRHVRRLKGQDGEVMLCDRIGAQFAFVRRDVMRRIVIPPVGGRLEGIMIVADGHNLDRAWCRAVWAAGYEVGYLRDVYTQHTGAVSRRNGADIGATLITAIDPATLEPVDADQRG